MVDKKTEQNQIKAYSKKVRFWRSKVVSAGEYKEVLIYPMTTRDYRRGIKQKRTKEEQAQHNQKRARDNLRRLLNANFSEKDFWFDFTYRDAPETLEEARRIFNNFIRRLKRRFGEMKFVHTVEKGKKKGRVHHHFICDIDEEYRNEVEKMWSLGRTRSRRLEADDKGFFGAAEYFAKESKGFRKWSSSKNLSKPKEEVRDGFSRRVLSKIIRGEPGGTDRLMSMREFADYKITELDMRENEYDGFHIAVFMKRRN